MGTLEFLIWQFSILLTQKGDEKTEKFLSDICIYEYKSIYSHV